MTVSQPEAPFAVPPDPGRAGTLDELVQRLRMLKVWAGNPSYDTIKDRINTTWTATGRPGAELVGKSTVADCFRLGRRRLSTDLVIAVVAALHPDAGYAAQWRQMLQVVGGESLAATQVRVHDELPEESAGFTGRAAELRQVRQALRRVDAGHGVVVITGMAGVGKTELAVHAGHLLHRQDPFDRVLFVNLRGFHPDPAQPPADPAAVLDSFLRLLGVAGQQIPYDLSGRVAAYRNRLAGTRTLVILDNAMDAEQVRSLIPAAPGCLVLITSRRRLTALRQVTHLTLDVFSPQEAADFLARTVPELPSGGDPGAAARIARRCGHLPLALELVGGHMRATPRWTLTDHADRLDERHHDRRLDNGISLALDLSHRYLAAGQRRQLLLTALHPGQDFDAYAVAALAGTDIRTAREHLGDLCRDHLLRRDSGGRYTLHDLVRADAAARVVDEDPPADRRAALTRLFDFYLANAATAMRLLYPAEAHLQPLVPATDVRVAVLTNPGAALGWLNTERPTLVAVVAHAAAHGWPSHAVRLSRLLFPYLNGGYLQEALTVHGHACHAADKPADKAHALTNLGVTHEQTGQYQQAADNLRQALRLFRESGDLSGEARALTNLGCAEAGQGRYRQAGEHYGRAVTLFLRADHQIGAAHALTNLGDAEGRMGRNRQAAEHLRQALALYRRLGHGSGEAWTLGSLGEAEIRIGRYGSANTNLMLALARYQQLGNRNGEAWILNSLGTVYTRLGQATTTHRQALATFRETGDRAGEASSLNGLGEAAQAAGKPADARTDHAAALLIAADIGDREQQARAHAGLGRAYADLAEPDCAQRHYHHALSVYTDLELPEAHQLRAHLAARTGGSNL